MNIPGVQRYDDLKPPPVSVEVFEQMQDDLRSPLCVILGLSEFLSSTASTPEQQKTADALKSNSQMLNKQIDELGKLFHKV